MILKAKDYNSMNDKKGKDSLEYKNDLNSFEFEEKELLYHKLETFIDASINQCIPSKVVAVCFNLYECDNNIWSMEIIGTDSFNYDSFDWACNEIIDFDTRENPFCWKQDEDWGCVLKEIIECLEKYLCIGKNAGILKKLKGVAVGFVDGDLHLLNK